MAITMKSDYALRLLLLLSIEGGRLSTSELVKKCKTQIPYDFAQKILSQLASSGILKSYKGKFGGYKLAKNPKDITVYDIVNAVDDMSSTITCFVETSNINFPEICTINEIWEIVMKRFEDSLKSVTLEELKSSFIRKLEEFERRNSE